MLNLLYKYLNCKRILNSGDLLHQDGWSDIGIAMRFRLWVMAFHQGEFGPWNWWLMLSIACILVLMSFSALISYLIRREKGQWGIPKVPPTFRVSKTIRTVMMVLGIVFPLFGASLIVLIIANQLQTSVRPI